MTGEHGQGRLFKAEGFPVTRISLQLGRSKEEGNHGDMTGEFTTKQHPFSSRTFPMIGATGICGELFSNLGGFMPFIAHRGKGGRGAGSALPRYNETQRVSIEERRKGGKLQQQRSYVDVVKDGKEEKEVAVENKRRSQMIKTDKQHKMIRTDGQHKFQAWRTKERSNNKAGLELKTMKEDEEWLQDCMVGTVHSIEVVPLLQERFYMEGYFTCKVWPMGGKLCPTGRRPVTITIRGAQYKIKVTEEESTEHLFRLKSDYAFSNHEDSEDSESWSLGSNAQSEYGKEAYGFQGKSSHCVEEQDAMKAANDDVAFARWKDEEKSVNHMEDEEVRKSKEKIESRVAVDVSQARNLNLDSLEVVLDSLMCLESQEVANGRDNKCQAQEEVRGSLEMGEDDELTQRETDWPNEDGLAARNTKNSEKAIMGDPLRGRPDGRWLKWVQWLKIVMTIQRKMD
ncbi:hypothetical protein SLEP1_g52707 [Rubroshorea leprosula]|uniref:Uncharacterized protein n=1 Tax=Rubroshorea leprosula TaxID=152421 RepID=A0AAV5M799_9ROSI|nr:hypothetical protein SLEP1_g52707 [Rubroshorea leprosula]